MSLDYLKTLFYMPDGDQGIVYHITTSWLIMPLCLFKQNLHRLLKLSQGTLLQSVQEEQWC